MAIELEDGTVVLSLPEQVEENKAKVEEVDIKVDNLAARVEAALAGVLHYKGSVATYSDLPADAEIGDVYNVIDTGANYAWTGSEWDELGSVVDLSNCVTLDSDQTITGVKTLTKRLIFKSSDNTSAVLSYAGSEMFNVGLTNQSYQFNRGSFEPLINAENSSLGDSTHKWYDLYLSNALNLGTSGILKYDSDASSFTSNSHISPAVTDSYNLGSSSYFWGNLYLKNKLFLGNSGNYIEADQYNSIFITRENSRIIRLTSSYLSAGADNSFDLGNTSYYWKDLYLKGNANIGTTGQIYTSSRGTIIRNTGNYAIVIRGSALEPINTNSVDVGSSTYTWKDIYLSGVISDGTNSVNVADLKALIDYAKAQGWIS